MHEIPTGYGAIVFWGECDDDDKIVALKNSLMEGSNALLIHDENESTRLVVKVLGSFDVAKRHSISDNPIRIGLWLHTYERECMLDRSFGGDSEEICQTESSACSLPIEILDATTYYFGGPVQSPHRYFVKPISVRLPSDEILKSLYGEDSLIPSSLNVCKSEFENGQYYSNLSIVVKLNYEHLLQESDFGNDHTELSSMARSEIEALLLNFMKQGMAHRYVFPDSLMVIPLPRKITQEISHLSRCEYHHDKDTSLGCLDMYPSFINQDDQLEDVLHLVVTKVNEEGSENSADKNNCVCCYLLGPPGSFAVELQMFHIEKTVDDSSISLALQPPECPGYESLLKQLLALASITSSKASSHLILSGCPGVGKTTIAFTLAKKIRASTDAIGSFEVHYVSVKDLILEASSNLDESGLVEQVVRFSSLRKKLRLLIIDDLQAVMGNEQEGDSPFVDHEQQAVLFAIAKGMDLISKIGSAWILGLSSAAMNALPSELVRVGRFEKEILMDAPTQHQRQEILSSCLSKFKLNDGNPLRWAEALAPRLAGCVASDLVRVCKDSLLKARTRGRQDRVVIDTAGITWWDLREAAKTCIPSQLKLLDVVAPRLASDSNLSEAEEIQEKSSSMNYQVRHDLAWKRFGGYHDVKRKLLRTVVGPWSRFVSGVLDSELNALGIRPPSGVLFHGPSGCGKSLAAQCLASSLALNMIKVKSSDVLDPYLGGSESTIRSLFARARAASPCILFFDEFDALACNRDDDDGIEANVQSRILSTLLNEMDGISNKLQVLVVAATNRLKSLDSALLRPGRLDEHILLDVPSKDDCRSILQLYLESLPTDPKLDVQALSSKCSEANMTCADIEGMCREVCLGALRLMEEASIHSGRSMIYMNDFLDYFKEKF